MIIVSKVGPGILKQDSKSLEVFSELVQKHHGIFGNTYEEAWRRRKGALKSALASDRYGLLVAKEDNVIVGFLDYWIIDCFVKNGKIAFLQNMRVYENKRNSGIGSLLVSRFEKEIRLLKCIEIHIMAGRPANKFYGKLGYKYKKSDVYMEKIL